MNKSSEFDKWFPAASKQIFSVKPRLRLICFPSSGTMEAIYTGKSRIEGKMVKNPLVNWAEKHEVQVLSVQLAGRGQRHRESFATSLHEVGIELARVLKPILSETTNEGGKVPWALLGHSMGCWAAFETALAINRLGGVPPPISLTVTCFAAPDIADRPWVPNSGLDEKSFMDECRGWGIKEAVLTTPHLWESFRDLLRADFTLFDTYPGPSDPTAQLSCPIYGCAATLDKRINAEMIQQWTKFQAPGYDFEMLEAIEGDHLFLLEDALKARWFNHEIVPLMEKHLVKDAPSQRAEEVPLPPPPPPPVVPTLLPQTPLVTKTKLRILCLHGFGCCDEILRLQTKRMRDIAEGLLETGKQLEWHFVSSPQEAAWDPKSYEARLVTSFFPNLPNRQWMRRVSAGGKAPVVQTGTNGELIADDISYVDWAEPLAYLLKQIAEYGPYDGVMGFSQGANLAVLLTALSEASAIPHKFDFVIPICGSAFGWEKQWPLASDVNHQFPAAPLFLTPLKTPSFHLIASGDPFRAASEKLVTLFDPPSTIVHHFNSGHKPPTQKATAGALAEYLTKILAGSV